MTTRCDRSPCSYRTDSQQDGEVCKNCHEGYARTETDPIGDAVAATKDRLARINALDARRNNAIKALRDAIVAGWLETGCDQTHDEIERRLGAQIGTGKDGILDMLGIEHRMDHRGFWVFGPTREYLRELLLAAQGGRR